MTKYLTDRSIDRSAESQWGCLVRKAWHYVRRHLIAFASIESFDRLHACWTLAGIKSVTQAIVCTTWRLCQIQFGAQLNTDSTNRLEPDSVFKPFIDGVQAVSAISIVYSSALCSSSPIAGTGISTTVLGVKGSIGGADSNVTYGWGSLILTPNPGQYKLCWCLPLEGSLCVASSSFSYAAGFIQFVGPDSGQSQFCTVGLPCTIGLQANNLGTITTESVFTANTGLMLKNACTDLAAAESIPATKRRILSSPGSAYPVYYDWNGDVMNPTAPGPSTLRLCWCSGPSCTDSDAPNYSYDVGRVHVVG